MFEGIGTLGRGVARHAVFCVSEPSETFIDNESNLHLASILHRLIIIVLRQVCLHDDRYAYDASETTFISIIIVTPLPRRDDFFFLSSLYKRRVISSLLRLLLPLENLRQGCFDSLERLVYLYLHHFHISISLRISAYSFQSKHCSLAHSFPEAV